MASELRKRQIKQSASVNRTADGLIDISKYSTEHIREGSNLYNQEQQFYQGAIEYNKWLKGGRQGDISDTAKLFMIESDTEELARRSRVVQSLSDSAGRSGPKYGGKAGKVINAANNMAGNSNILSFDNKKQNILGI